VIVEKYFSNRIALVRMANELCHFQTTSFRLVASEKAYLSRSVVFMTITTFKLLIHMVADYSLYWILMTIRYHGRFQSPVLRKFTLEILLLLPTLIPLSGVGTTCFHHVVIKIRHLCFTTGRLPDVNPS
jgi:hypothetical protein